MEISEFDQLNEFSKKRLLAMAENTQKVLDAEKAILNGSKRFERFHQVVFIANDIAIIENHANPTYPDSPFTFALKMDEAWHGRGNYYPTIEHAYLGALGEKHQGLNSQFAYFAMKMLS